MSGILIPDPIMQWFDAAGLPLAFGRVKTYVAGTTTFLPAYSDFNLLVPYGPSIPLDAEGKAVIYLGPYVYKVDVQDAFGVSIDGYPRDNVPGRAATLQQLTGIINIKDFGAIGDGVTNDTAAVQSAINAAYALINSHGRTTTVFAPQGEYVCSTLTFKNTPTIGFGGAIFTGAGIAATQFTLAAGTNGPLFDCGGALAGDALVTAGFREFTINGNASAQTVAAPLLRLRRVDRCNYANIVVTSSKGDGVLVNNSSASFSGVEVFLCAGNGVTVEDSDSVVFDTGCFFNNNVGYGLSAAFIASGGILTNQGQTSIVVRDAHFEQNQTGEILLNNFDNAVVVGNLINAYATGGVGSLVSPIVSVSGSSAWNRIQDNFYDNVNMIDAYDDGTGMTDPALTIQFGALTHDNVWGNNISHESNCLIGGVLTKVQSFLAVSDLGRNYSLDPSRFSAQAIVQNEGGHTHAGWQAQARTNLLLDSEDLTTANWTVVNVTGRASDAALGSPYVSTGVATEIAMTASTVASIQQAVAGLAVASGDLYTFSAWVIVPPVSPITRDVRMEIYDSGNVLLVRRVSQLTHGWQRVSVTLQATTAYVELRCRMTVASFSTSNGFRAWGCQLNQGDMAPYAPTAAAAVSTRTGLVAMRVTATKANALHQSQTTVGAAGAASALPATPAGYFKVENAAGTVFAVPFYASS